MDQSFKVIIFFSRLALFGQNRFIIPQTLKFIVLTFKLLSPKPFLFYFIFTNIVHTEEKHFNQ